MGYSLKELGGYMGGKDHTTVIHNINTFKNLYETEVAFKNKYYSILNQIKKDYESSTMEYLDQVELES
jgi:chromosomal replication initiation ATPase DnaA